MAGKMSALLSEENYCAGGLGGDVDGRAFFAGALKFKLGLADKMEALETPY